MFSQESINQLGLGKMIAAAWVIFTTVYFLLSFAIPYIVRTPVAQNQAVQNSFQNGQIGGYQTAIGQLGQALATQIQGGCKEFVPVTIASGTTIGIISANCLQQPAATGTTPQK